MMLLVKIGDPRGPKRTWLSGLAFAILAIGPYVVLFWLLMRRQ